MEIGLRLKNHGYKVDLEVKSNGKHIDVLASKDSDEKIFELATLDLYGELKYSGFAGDIPDRARSIMIEKITNQISIYAKSHSGHIILILNLTYSHDVDLHGLVYALQGSNIPNFVFDEGKLVNRFTTFQRDPEFLNLNNANKLSGVIHCRNEFNGTDIKLGGNIIPNDSAEVRLDEKDIEEIKEILFD